MTTPRVLVPVRLSPSDVDPRVAGANRIFHDVVALVRAAGLEPVLTDDPSAGFDDVAGLVLPGGGDIDPARYGGDTTAPVYDVNPAQDVLDVTLARRAADAGLPILGICRGLQVLNVVFGGTLVEDLAPTAVEHRDDAGDGSDITWAWHEVLVEPGSALADAYGTRTVRVASGHHQGIGRLGARLTASAVAADGLVEAIAHETLPVLAVQWHPEAEGTAPADAAAPFEHLARSIHARR